MPSEGRSSEGGTATISAKVVDNALQVDVTDTGIGISPDRADHLFAAIKRALAMYKNRAVWMELVKKVMALDFSWKASAKEYAKLYQKVTAK